MFGAPSGYQKRRAWNHGTLAPLALNTQWGEIFKRISFDLESEDKKLDSVLREGSFWLTNAFSRFLNTINLKDFL